MVEDPGLILGILCLRHLSTTAEGSDRLCVALIFTTQLMSEVTTGNETYVNIAHLTVHLFERMVFMRV